MAAASGGALAKRAYTIPEFCAVYGIGSVTAWKERKARRLVAHEVCGKLVIFAEDAEAWRNSHPVADPDRPRRDPAAARQKRTDQRAAQ